MRTHKTHTNRFILSPECDFITIYNVRARAYVYVYVSVYDRGPGLTTPAPSPPSNRRREMNAERGAGGLELCVKYYPSSRLPHPPFPPFPPLAVRQLLALITAACQFSIQISSLSGECRGLFHQ